ncbi:hypothetical protein ACG02S_00575 [Roseateles sp. DC23W]|uniref:L,D-transpeptidase n=1 Tax=Pelomonas dachongensis TaxID=3299029 RepID=A0ABW7EHY0_9BURK
MQSGAPADVDAAAQRRRDILAGLVQGGVIAAVVLAGLYFFMGHRLQPGPAPAAPPAARPLAITAPAAPPMAIERRLDLGDVVAPADVTRVASWAVDAADNGNRAFVIVDKRRAQIYVFETGGRLIGTSPVLLGYAAGDRSVEGIGDRPIEQVQPHERTTPAGRFQSAPGRNTLNEDVVWVDYHAAVSMHRVRATNPAERRLERLATKTAADNRISWGCINVPVAFFDQTVWPHIGKGRGIVYVLPEKEPLTAFFPAAQQPRHYAQAGAAPGNSAKP